MQVLSVMAGVLGETVVLMVKGESVLADNSQRRIVPTSHHFSWMTAVIGGIEHPG